MKSKLTVTNIQVYPVREPRGKLMAFVRVLLNDELHLTGMKLYDGANGLFLSYPNDPAHKGEDYRQLFYPITRELRDDIEKRAIAEYEQVMAQEWNFILDDEGCVVPTESFENVLNSKVVRIKNRAPVSEWHDWDVHCWDCNEGSSETIHIKAPDAQSATAIAFAVTSRSVEGTPYHSYGPACITHDLSGTCYDGKEMTRMMDSMFLKAQESASNAQENGASISSEVK